MGFKKKAQEPEVAVKVTEVEPQEPAVNVDSLEEAIQQDMANHVAGVTLPEGIFSGVTNPVNNVTPTINVAATTPAVTPVVNIEVPPMINPNQTFGSTARTFGSGVFNNFTPWLSGGADAEVARLIELADACIVKHDSGMLKGNYKLHAISREKQTGTFSAFVISISQIINGKEVAAYHPFIIESSRSPLEPLYHDSQAGKIEIIIPTAEAYTETFRKEVVKQIRSDYKNQHMDVIECGMQVIPREAEIKQEDDLLVYLSSAVNSCAMFIESMNPNAVRFNLKQITDDNTIRVGARTFVDVQNVTPANLPVRSDIVIEMNASSHGNSGKQGISEQRSMLLSRASAYVDLIYTPPPVAFGQPAYQPGQSYYIPRISITQLETDLAGSSLEFILLGIANITVLGRNKTYGIAWKNKNALRSGVNIRDFGAVGLQVPGLLPNNEPGIINVDESDLALRQLMETVLNPNTVYTLEVEQSSPNSWLLGIFADAAKDDTTGYEARRRIIMAADNLTNGHFSPILSQLANVAPGTDLARLSLVRNTHDQNYVGYYVEGGEKRDIRELDLLAILNLKGKNDPDLVNEFIRTTFGQEDVLVRLDKRARILRTFANGVHLRGYSTKYDLQSVFVTALAKAVEATGIKVNNNAVGLRGDQMAYQSAQDWASVLTSAEVGANMFANAGVYTGVNTGFQFNPYAHTQAFYVG